MDYGVSMLLAPAIGLFSGWFVREGIILAISPDPLTRLVELCSTPAAGELCSIMSLTVLLLRASVVVLAASVLLPTLYFLTIRSLSSDRDALARAFPKLTAGYLVLVALVLVAQAGLMAMTGADLLWSEALRGRLLVYAVGASAIFAFGLLASAVSILSDLSRALTVEPVHVTAVVAGAELDTLIKRVQRVAEQLDVPAPTHVVVGVEPNVFVTAAPVRLRGSEELRGGATLYLSSALLRMVSAAELDSLLARELSLLRETPDFTGKFVPMSASVIRVSSYVEEEGEGKGALSQIVRVPASGFLAAMQSTLRFALRRVREQREHEADRAGAAFTDPKALFSGLAKLAALNLRWPTFRHAYELYMLHGQTRRNLSLDLLAHVAQYAANGRTRLADSLLTFRIPHAFDENDTLAARAETHSVQIRPILADVSAHLSQAPRSSRVLDSLEEQVTTFENDYFRVPGRRVVVNQEESLPAELAASNV